jgi:creatinine amidohydrolase/Fe(II)-dependent formamide hydrolase-like protein
VPQSKTDRVIGDLTFAEVASRLRASSILCLPMGSMEQHGPHLPLNTDTVLVEAFTRRIVERWGETYDLWRLPPFAIGLSREHAWAPGTLSLSVSGMTACLRDVGREIARALPSRNLLIVNGHGGNRGILEALGRELRDDFGLNLCALHLGAMISPVSDSAMPEIHAGKDETSAMMALAPDLVRQEKIHELKSPPGGAAVRSLILDPATSWPWSSDDPRLGHQGVIGDAAAASVEHGNAIVQRVVEATGTVLRQLAENGKSVRKS